MKRKRKRVYKRPYTNPIVEIKETEYLKKAGLNPHIHTKMQLRKMTKTGLIRLVIKLEKIIVKQAYEIYKSTLPRMIQPTFAKALAKRKALPWHARQMVPKRKTKRKFSRKQLAAQRLFAKRAKAGTLRKRRRR